MFLFAAAAQAGPVAAALSQRICAEIEGRSILFYTGMKARLGGHLLVLASVVVHLSLPWVTLQTLVSLYGGNGEALRAFLPRLRPLARRPIHASYYYYLERALWHSAYVRSL